jgi:diguanylate cyclase (GGDEF)-like protein
MLSVVPRAYTRYIIAALGPLAIGQFASIELLHTAVGVLILITMSSLLYSGNRLGMVLMENFSLQEKLEGLVRHDSLTGIINRRGFDEQFDIEWRRAVRSGSTLSLAMIDIDNFKTYNDNHGHPAGDECLKAVALTLSAALPRAADLLARYGGEEFVVLLPSTDLDGARIVAERLRKAIAGIKYPNVTDKDDTHLSVSIGLANTQPGRQQTSQELLQTADQALYMAKAEGKNRVVVLNPGNL